jgi:hypothetical protein
MNNTKTRTIVDGAIVVVIFIAATLVLGGTFAATTSTPAAFGYKKDNGNDNTIIPQEIESKTSANGFDSTAETELQNLLCTHPSSTCSAEGSEGIEATGAAQQGPQGAEALNNTGLSTQSFAFGSISSGTFTGSATPNHIAISAGNSAGTGSGGASGSCSTSVSFTDGGCTTP